ncbi:MAG TPA: hypothetical protein VFP61_05235 [Acidimicrobiales bacterium]|nr:hypothetical protein [Acidimicrobiales bacterium]
MVTATRGRGIRGLGRRRARLAPLAAEAAQGLLAGLVGTAVMTASYGVERRLRGSTGGPLDYDDSTVPSHAAMVVLRIDHLGDVGQRRLGALVHWGYGSAMGMVRVLLGRRLRPRDATATYWAGLMAMTGALFPLLGGTPPPWRWRGSVVATSLVQHAVYAATVGAVVDIT